MTMKPNNHAFVSQRDLIDILKGELKYNQDEGADLIMGGEPRFNKIALLFDKNLRPILADQKGFEVLLSGEKLLSIVSAYTSFDANEPVKISWDDFSENASDIEIAEFVRAVGHIGREAGHVETGYRLLANTGINAHQEVPHLHVHIFAGRPLGPMLAR